MAHHKRRKRKAFKGCCGMCALRSTDGRRNGRIRTKQEKAAAVSERELRVAHLDLERLLVAPGPLDVGDVAIASGVLVGAVRSLIDEAERGQR